MTIYRGNAPCADGALAMRGGIKAVHLWSHSSHDGAVLARVLMDIRTLAANGGIFSMLMAAFNSRAKAKVFASCR